MEIKLNINGSKTSFVIFFIFNKVKLNKSNLNWKLKYEKFENNSNTCIITNSNGTEKIEYLDVTDTIQRMIDDIDQIYWTTSNESKQNSLLTLNQFKIINSLNKINLKEILNKIELFLNENNQQLHPDHPSISEALIYTSLRFSGLYASLYKQNKASNENEKVFKFFDKFMNNGILENEIKKFQTKLKSNIINKKERGKIDVLGLNINPNEKVVMRFAPEPNGYLHIGHVKAALINKYITEKYNGTLIIRFDDTNPIKEKIEYEEVILEDLNQLGIISNKITHTSDYFDIITNYALELIRKGLAYCDDTPADIMKHERTNGIASKHRNISPEETERIFIQEMCTESEIGVNFCLRAKISVDNPNKAMRDPVIFRVIPNSYHHITKDKYKAYPLYDFSIAIVDNIEGITHAIRTSEYKDRLFLYQWICRSLNLVIPVVYDFSRLSFTFTTLSKRKLTHFININSVSGWDDPSMPTVRGMIRRGLSKESLMEYILVQGMGKSDMLLEWDKIWSINSKIIDPISPRYIALTNTNTLVPVTLISSLLGTTINVPLFPKFPQNGTKTVLFEKDIYLENSDASLLTLGMEITLMYIGNFIVKDIKQNPLSMTLEHNPQGSHKSTTFKLTWLSQTNFKPATIITCSYLITKKSLNDNDNFNDFIAPQNKFYETAYIESSFNVQKGNYLQFLRKGFHICDSIDPLVFIYIPDGSSASVKPHFPEKFS